MDNGKKERFFGSDRMELLAHILGKDTRSCAMSSTGGYILCRREVGGATDGAEGPAMKVDLNNLFFKICERNFKSQKHSL